MPEEKLWMAGADIGDGFEIVIVRASDESTARVKLCAALSLTDVGLIDEIEFDANGVSQVMNYMN